MTTTSCDLVWPATVPSTWTARWIAPRSAKENNSSYFRARKSFELTAVPTRAVLHIAAESIYRLFVNGILVGRGPVRGVANTNFFDSYDIARHLLPGKNWIAVKVHTPGKLPSFKYSPSEPGVLIQSDDLQIKTDSSWQVQVATEHKPDAPQYTFQIGPAEWKDLRTEPLKWQTGEDKGTWEAATVLHENEKIGGKSLLGRDIPALVESRFAPVDVPVVALTPPLADTNDTAIAVLMTNETHRPLPAPINISPLLSTEAEPVVINPPGDGSGVTLILNFVREFNGAFELDIEGPAGTIVDIGQEEQLVNGRLNLVLFGYRFADRYILRDGRQVIGNEFAERGFRLIQIALRNFNKPIKIHSATGINYLYPYVNRGSFVSSDNALNQLWKVCGETLRICTTDTIVDCPWRENACYLNDMIVEVVTSLQAFGDPRALARGLKLSALQRRSDDLFPAVVPSGKVEGMTLQQSHDHMVLTAGNLTFPLILDEFYDYTGDRALCTDLAEQMIPMLDRFASWEDSDGIARPPEHIWNFIDWSYPLDLKGHQSSALEWLRVMSLEATARLLKKLHPGRDVIKLTSKAKQLAAAIEKRFWNAEEQYYTEGMRTALEYTKLEADQSKVVDVKLDEKNSKPLVTELAQAYAILSGHLPEARKQQLAAALNSRKLLSPDLFMHHFVLRALVATGHTQQAFDRIHEFWTPIVNSGSPTIWEMGVQSKGKDAFEGAGSLCHGFATTPIDFMQAAVLGIRPTDAGFSRCTFAPHPVNLTQAQGRIPTPHGNLHVAWTREGKSVKAELTIPNGVTVEVAGGKSLGAGKHSVTVDGLA